MFVVLCIKFSEQALKLQRPESNDSSICLLRCDLMEENIPLIELFAQMYTRYYIINLTFHDYWKY